jgi:hypothetical protein
MRRMGHVEHVGERIGVYRVLVGRPDGRRPLGRPSHSWGIILKWIFEKCNGGMDWIDVAEDRDR